MFFKRRNRIFCAGNPRGGGALLRNLSDNSAHSEASQAGQNATQNSAQDLTPQEQLLAGTLELDPENDPVICTTESGLEIKYAMAIDLGAGDKYPTLSSLPAGPAGTPSGLRGYAYLKMGKYNWIIIGYNTTSSLVVSYNFNGSLVFSNYLENPADYTSFAGLLETNSDAGVIISSAASNGIVWGKYALSLALDYSLAVNAADKGLTELSSGEVLVLCQGTAGSSSFGSNNVYDGSTLQTAMRNLYYPSTGKNGAEFSAQEKKLIVGTPLVTATRSYPYTNTYAHTEYLFPLAGPDWASNFKAATYLPENGHRSCNSTWWLRSLYYDQTKYAYYVNSNGSIGNQGSGVSEVSSSFYLRPAMVIKI